MVATCKDTLHLKKNSVGFAVNKILKTSNSMKLRLLKTKRNVERFMLKQQKKKKKIERSALSRALVRRMDRLDPRTLSKDYAELAEMF